ncbi:MAG: ion channel [Thermoanaerobaculia bacterium]
MLWIAMMWTAWVLIYSADPQSLVDTHTKLPVDLPSRIFYVAYSLSTLGNGDFQPNGSFWRIVSSFATIGGLGSVTLAITFLIDVIAAVVHKRTFASLVSDLGSKPEVILERAWNGEELQALDQHLVQITGMIHMYTEEHLAYPVLHYFHSEGERTAATLHVARLHDLLLLLCEGLHPDKRLPPIVTAPLRNAIDGFATTMRESDVREADEPLAGPSLEVLRTLGIPTVAEAEFTHAVQSAAKNRRLLKGLLLHDGWI